MALSQIEEKIDDSRVLRAVVLVGAVIALVAAILAFRDGRARAHGRDGAQINLGPDAYDTVVTAPADPEAFVDTTIWALPSQRTAIFVADGAPTARIGSPSTGMVVGLQGDQGMVALGLVPPGLASEPVEFFVSPVSTVLAVAGLHPDITSSDPDTYVARLIRIGQHRSLPELAAAVDGQRLLAAWGQTEQDLLHRIVSDVAASSTADVSGGCPEEQPVDASVTRCGSRLSNTSGHAVLIAGSDGQPCALIPAAHENPTPQGRDALTKLIVDGVPIESQPMTEPLIAGVVDAADCGTVAELFVAPGLNSDWVAQSNGYRVWTDDVLSMARFIGADISSTQPAAVSSEVTQTLGAYQVTGSGSLTAIERLQAMNAILSDPPRSSALGLSALTETTTTQLQALVDLLAGLYR